MGAGHFPLAGLHSSFIKSNVFEMILIVWCCCRPRLWFLAASVTVALLGPLSSNRSILKRQPEKAFWSEATRIRQLKTAGIMSFRPAKPSKTPLIFCTYPWDYRLPLEPRHFQVTTNTAPKGHKSPTFHDFQKSSNQWRLWIVFIVFDLTSTATSFGGSGRIFTGSLQWNEVTAFNKAASVGIPRVL